MLARVQTPDAAELPAVLSDRAVPNAPLVLASASGLLAHHSHGREHTYAQAVSYLALAIWAYLDLFQGVNAFRRLLGLVYTISTAVHLANALHHCKSGMLPRERETGAATGC